MKKLTGNHYYGACDGFHFSDNYVTGDNIYLRELQNFFFEVLGMMSITHYGAIGDGRTDNYGPIQVAIDDANRRGLNYLYVPYGRFIYTGELINIGDIKFVGNPKAKIVNIRTGEEITILQFGIRTNDNYYSKTELDALLESKQDNLIAGDGIRIDYNIISATGGGSGGTTFTTCPFPRSWENDTATNEYGTWSFDVTNGGYNDYPTKNALDQDDNTMWVRTGADATQDTILKVNLPQDAEIKPTRFKVVAARVNGGFSIEGYNGSGWTTLVTHAEGISSSKETIERQVSTNNYFTAFRLVFKHTETNNPAIYEFQVLSGEFRVGNIGGE